MAANPAQTPVTTIVPFADRSKLPACAAACGPLYDANGGCVPPAIPSGPVTNYEACFCINANVVGFSTASTAVCPNACSAEPGGQASIASWFSSLCHVTAAPAGNGGTATTSATTATTTAVSGSSSSSKASGNWISNHWQWVIMLVVLIVGIAGIWIGACIWRRRYLRRKDRQTSLGQKQSGSANRPSWGPPNKITSDSHTNPEAAYPVFESAEKPRQKKKWTVSRRT